MQLPVIRAHPVWSQRRWCDPAPGVRLDRDSAAGNSRPRPSDPVGTQTPPPTTAPHPETVLTRAPADGSRRRVCRRCAVIDDSNGPRSASRCSTPRRRSAATALLVDWSWRIDVERGRTAHLGRQIYLTGNTTQLRRHSPSALRLRRCGSGATAALRPMPDFTVPCPPPAAEAGADANCG
jgi:hypothetical protein